MGAALRLGPSAWGRPGSFWGVGKQDTVQVRFKVIRLNAVGQFTSGSHLQDSVGRFVGTKGRANGLRGVQRARVIVDQTGPTLAHEPFHVSAVGIDTDKVCPGFLKGICLDANVGMVGCDLHVVVFVGHDDDGQTGYLADRVRNKSGRIPIPPELDGFFHSWDMRGS